MDPDMEEQERIREMFGLGRPGEPVPQVDPEDVKAVWEVGQESVKENPRETLQSVLRFSGAPGANVSAVTYRMQQIGILQLIRPDVMAPLLQDKLEAVFRSVAEIPMEWIGVGTVRRGLPFDPDDFVRRVREA